MLRPNRISPIQRGLSALLTVLYLTVALGAVQHAGEHDESGLEWLPQEFHHHHYEISDDDPDGHLTLHDFCVACHWSRLGQRHADEGATALAAGPVLRIVATGPDHDPRDGAAYLPDSRGPPSA